MPLALLLATLAASPQRPPDGYSCRADAFETIAAIHGRGIGAVTLEAGADYAPGATQFSFAVEDRLSGRGRFAANWALSGATLDAGAVFTGLRIPLWELRAPLFTVTIAIDGATVATRRYRREGDGVVPEGGPVPLFPDNAVASSTRDPWLPDLRGHRTLGYRLTDPSGALLGGELFLLPDWDRQRGAISKARRAAEGLRRKRRCSASYVLRRAS